MAGLRTKIGTVLPRGSTRMWMFLTFALFVGAAVAGVGFYVVFVLRADIEEARREMLVRQAERIAILIEQTASSEERLQIVQDIARLTNLRITALASDTVFYDQGMRALGDDALAERPEMQAALQGDIGIARELVSQGDATVPMLYVALPRPESGFVVRVGQPEPLLFALVEDMETTLIAGMIAALVLALVGSWIAADKVTQPMRAISSSARAISEGKFDETIQVETRAAEIQDLTKSLNRMSASYREKIEELERLARMQTEFIGNVSHEVRNPIFAVGGYLEALATPSLNDDQRRRYAEKALLNLQRLNNLFNDLIEIARLEYREDLIKPSTFDLQELVEEIGEMLEPKAHDKGLNLELANPHLLVDADRNRIRQVLINLIDNAIAYSDTGTVRCRFRQRLDKVRIEVIDTGRGIPVEHLSRIFERFYRVDPDRSRKSGGTGLGLSIVKQIIQAHGEQVRVESTLGRGTRFWFELPYAGQVTEAMVS